MMNKKAKSIISVLLAIVLCFSSSTVAFASVDDGGSVTFELSSDKKDYARDETITITTNIKNSTQENQNVSISYLSTGFIQLEQSNSTASVSIGAEKDIQQKAKAWRLITPKAKHQDLVDGLMGHLWSFLYEILAMLSNNYKMLQVTVDDCPAVVLAKVITESDFPTTTDDEVYTISFELNYDGATENPESQQIIKGKRATEPVVNREGYQLIGWYVTSKGFSEIFDFNNTITQDLTLYAKWYDENDIKDSDGDGLKDSLEIQFGSDPYSTDTDGDGVDDFTELNWLNTDPSSINNGSDDADCDGLTNAEECMLGTNPTYYDTDHDGLSDYDEVHKYKTDPINEDTDADGVVDGTEVFIGSNPLIADKEFSSVTYTGEISEGNPVVASATVITDGDGADTLEIHEVTHSDNYLVSNSIPGYLGSAYDFSTEGTFISATLTFEYDESLGKISEDFQPRIYYVNEKTGELEELPNQIIENGKITANTSHFSTYILLNKVEFDKVWDLDIKDPTEEGTGFKDLLISFVVDSSGSMSWNDPSNLRKELTKNFIDKMTEEDRASVVDFDSYARTNSDFTSNKESLKIAVDWIDSSGGTCMYRGLSQSFGLFKNLESVSNDALKVIFLLTDGSDDGSGGYYSESQYMTLVDDCVANGIQVYTVGLGHEVNAQLLEKIATEGNGKYYFAEKDLDLIEGFDTLRQETIDYITDSNNDGICDYYTDLINNGKLVLSNGADDLIGVIDKYGDSADWDGDGLLNGEEIQIVSQSNGAVVVHMKSHPLVTDSDGDGYSDYDETKKMKTNPLQTTKTGAYDISSLKNDNQFVYSEQVNDNNFGNKIAGIFDWKKTDESKETFINYFYDYASEKSINQNSEEIKKLAKREKAWETIETITKILKLGKSLTDLGTDLGSFDQDVKGQITRYNNKHSDALSLYNKKDYDAVIKKYSDVKDFNDSLKTFNNVIDVIAKQSTIDKVDKIVSVTNAVVKNIDGLKKVKINLGTKLNNFSNKYQRWLGKRPTGDISYGTVISVAADGVDLVTSIASINNYYGKLRANAEAFEEYIDLIEYISTHGNNKDYIRNAAGDITKIVLDKSYSEFYKQLNTAIAKESAESFINMAISIVGDFCPYVKVANTILTVVKAAISITGMPAYAEMLVKAQCIDSISDGCIYFLSELIDIQANYYSYENNMTDSVNLYLIQLTQSRIVGEKAICDYLKAGSIVNWISKLINHTSNKETDQNFGIIIDGIYSYAKNLNLILSSKLPKYVNGQWTQNNSSDGGGGGGTGGGRF